MKTNNTTNYMLGALFILILMISGCAQQQTVVKDTPPVDRITDTPAYTVPPYELKSSGCDENNFYAVVTPEADFSGTAELRIYDNVQKDKIISTKIKEVSFTVSDNKFVIPHDQQLTNNMDFSFCLGGSCKKAYCVVDACLKYSDESLLCNSKAECKYDGFCFSFKCSDMNSTADCAKYSSRCEWYENVQDKVNPYCRLKACPLHNTEDGCNAGYNCEWLGNTCATFNCRSLTSPTSCGHDPRCTWKDSQYGSGSCDTK